MAPAVTVFALMPLAQCVTETHHVVAEGCLHRRIGSRTSRGEQNHSRSRAPDAGNHHNGPGVRRFQEG